MKFPVTLYHPDSKDKNKTLSARDEAELAALQRIGWKVKE